MTYQRFVSSFVAFAVTLGASDQLCADEKPKIDERFRVLISAATAIDKAEFEKLATSPTAPTADSFKENTLSSELIMLAFKPGEDDQNEKRQFRFLTDRVPKPAQIAREMYRGIGRGRATLVFRPVTMIQSERITRCEADVDGNTATGSFDFHVPGLYEGNADFVAKKNDDQWQIVEFKMKTMGIHVAIDDEGKWRRVAKTE